MARESAEERFRALIREELATERQRETDEKDPGIAKLRRIIHEVLDEREKGRSKSEPKSEPDKGEPGILEQLGIR